MNVVAELLLKYKHLLVVNTTVSVATLSVVTDSVYPPPVSPVDIAVQKIYFRNGLLRANISWRFDEGMKCAPALFRSGFNCYTSFSSDSQYCVINLSYTLSRDTLCDHEMLPTCTYFVQFLLLVDILSA